MLQNLSAKNTNTFVLAEILHLAERTPDSEGAFEDTPEPCPEGTSEEPCPEAETFTAGYVEGYAEGLPEGYEDSTEDVDPEYEPSPEESLPEALQEDTSSETYDEGYDEGSAEGYSAGYEVGEYGLSTPEELSPEYSESGRKRIHEQQALFCML